MGTATSHTGSGKDWDSVADDGDLADWLDSLPDDDDDGDEPQGGGNGSDRDEPYGHDKDEVDSRPRGPAFPPGTLARIARALRSGVDGPGGEAGAGQSGSAGAGGGAPTGGAGHGGRTPSVARAGGRTVAGVSAYQRGDAAALGELGLSLAELEGLEDDWDRAVAIADAAVGDAPSDANDEDARWAAVQAATWAFAQDQRPEPREIIEQFVADYIYRKVAYEVGHGRRDGSRDGADSVTSERSLRAGIRICVRSEIEADFSAGSSVADLSNLVTRVYEYTLDVWAAP